jgi:hypothetical protein
MKDFSTYVTRSTLNANKSNAILMVTALVVKTKRLIPDS